MDAPAVADVIAFLGHQRLASGNLPAVARQLATQLVAEQRVQLSVFDAHTSRPIDLDWRGSADEVVARLPLNAGDGAPVVAAPASRGRPKLGVVAREVTLLPRHWQWLGEQPGGASAALRRLIEQARRDGADVDTKRQAQESAYRFIHAMAGDFGEFEEATRALFAGDPERFDACTRSWPADIRDHAQLLARAAFAGTQ